MGKNKAKNQRRKKQQKKKKAAKKKQARQRNPTFGYEDHSLDLLERRKQEGREQLAQLQHLDPASMPEQAAQLEAFSRLGYFFYHNDDKTEYTLADEFPFVIGGYATFEEAREEAVSMAGGIPETEPILEAEEQVLSDLREVIPEQVFHELIVDETTYLFEELIDTSKSLAEVSEKHVGLHRAKALLPAEILLARKWDALGSVSGLDDPLRLTEAEQEAVAAIPVVDDLPTKALAEVATQVIEGHEALASIKPTRLAGYLRNLAFVEHVLQMES